MRDKKQLIDDEEDACDDRLKDLNDEKSNVENSTVHCSIFRPIEAIKNRCKFTHKETRNKKIWIESVSLFHEQG